MQIRVYLTGILRREGFGIQNSSCKDGARQGDKDAQFKVAEELEWACHQSCCFDSLTWKAQCNKAECKKWYLLAAENGSAVAQERLGSIYSTGGYCEIEKNDTEAMKWRLKAADQGYVPAYKALAQFYCTHKNYTEAAKWYEKAAEKGDNHAQMILVKIYVSGQGVPQDTQKAREWALKAVQGGEMGKQYELGDIYAETEPPNYEEAYYWSSFARERYRNNGARGGNKSLEKFEKHLSSEQIFNIQKRVDEDLARHCLEKTMKATCQGGR